MLTAHHKPHAPRFRLWPFVRSGNKLDKLDVKAHSAFPSELDTVHAVTVYSVTVHPVIMHNDDVQPNCMRTVTVNNGTAQIVVLDEDRKWEGG